VLAPWEMRQATDYDATCRSVNSWEVLEVLSCSEQGQGGEPISIEGRVMHAKPKQPNREHKKRAAPT
jgi:hypothetical protein